MSWDSYVDSVLGNSGGAATKACIIGQDGSIWTPSGANPKALAITAAEAQALGGGMKGKNERCIDAFTANGLKMEGEKYQFIRDVNMDGRIMIFKNKDKGGLAVASSNTAVVIAFTPEANKSQSGNSIKAVETIAKYLEGMNY